MKRFAFILFCLIALAGRPAGIDTGWPTVWVRITAGAWSGNYFVESSTDLAHWKRISTQFDGQPYVCLVDNQCRFYRIIPFLCSETVPYFDDAYFRAMPYNITATVEIIH